MGGAMPSLALTVLRSALTLLSVGKEHPFEICGGVGRRVDACGASWDPKLAQKAAVVSI